jgi:hypothetical protein
MPLRYQNLSTTNMHHRHTPLEIVIKWYKCFFVFTHQIVWLARRHRWRGFVWLSKKDGLLSKFCVEKSIDSNKGMHLVPFLFVSLYFCE